MLNDRLRVPFSMAALLAFISTASSASAESNEPSYPVISTIAGSGHSGTLGGPALSAEFMDPTGLAFGPDGTLYIVDSAAQRVRSLTPSGEVRTIAGSGVPTVYGLGVPGGYANGSASHARFNHPIGIAVDKNNAIYIGDTKNNCIRLIKNGSVTTYAGNALHPGGNDGNRISATFVDPRSLALDAEHNLYVADPPNGIRVIQPNGMVTSVRTTHQTLALSIGRFSKNYFRTASDEVVMAASASTIEMYDPAGMRKLLDIPLEANFTEHPPRSGYASIGPASSIAQYDAFSFVYADPLYRTVRWAVGTFPDYVRTLTHEPLENAANFSGSFHDGSNAEFIEPSAVVLAPDGTIVVADEGAKRIRKIGRFDERSGEMIGATGVWLPPVPTPGEYRIALFGNSYVFTGSPWEDAMPGLLQNDLNRKLGHNTNIRICPLRKDGIMPIAELSFIDTFLDTGAVDAVVLDMPSYGQFTTPSASAYFVSELSSLATHLQETKEKLKQAGVPLYVVFHPGAWDIPGEMPYRMLPRLANDSEGASDIAVHDPGETEKYRLQVLTVLQAVGIDPIDVWPAIAAYRSSPTATPIFGAWDHHFTKIGNGIIADAIAKRLLDEHPWIRKSSK